jgi:hypothetical protein
MRSKALLVLILLTAVIAVAAMMTRQEKSDVAGAGEPLFAHLLDNINDITTVVGVGHGETFTLVREGNRWLVSEKNNYPADQNNARELVLGTARLKRIEAKTSNPDLYAKIGLDDINNKDGNAVRYSFQNAAGNTLAEILIGNSRLGRSDPQLNEYFVREPAMAQSWLVEGKLPDAIGAVEWLDSSVLNVHRERVREVTLRHPDGEVVTISKKKPSQRTFDLHGAPDGVETESELMVSDLGRALATLDMEDVIPASETSVPDDGLTVEMTTFDGLRVILNSVKDEERTLARIQASFDESLVAPEFLPEGAQAQGESTNLLTAQKVREEVNRLNDKWRGWTYVLPEYRAKYMSVRNEDFVKAAKEKKASGG